MRFGYYDRLSPARKKIYRRSDGIAALGLPAGLDLGATVARIEAALRDDERATVQRECQNLIDALVAGYHVPRVPGAHPGRAPGRRLRRAAWPLRARRGEAPAARSPPGCVPRSRRQVVAFKTFLRTVIHELCHHLDYELFALEETFPYRGLLQARIEPGECAARAAAGDDRVRRRPVTAARLGKAHACAIIRSSSRSVATGRPGVSMRRPARLEDSPTLQRRSLNRGSRAG